ETVVITITEKARSEVRRIIEEQNMADGVALRVGVKGGGCSGFSYTLGFDDKIGETDQVSQFDDLKVVCDPKSFLYLNGTQLDFEDNLMGRGFKFGNPNAAKSCGCGESFSV
ncbi:MAG: iron-sulfur cluster assembly accessory protein, partial [Planctomycetota bacterium]